MAKWEHSGYLGENSMAKQLLPPSFLFPQISERSHIAGDMMISLLVSTESDATVIPAAET